MEFEKKRNRPVKYSRDLVSTTLTVMQRVKAIRQRREAVFHAKRLVRTNGTNFIFFFPPLPTGRFCLTNFYNSLRMRGNKQRQREAELKEIRQNIDLVISPLAANAPKIAVPTAAKTKVRTKKAVETMEE
jgi:hypothetical protein